MGINFSSLNQHKTAFEIIGMFIMTHSSWKLFESKMENDKQFVLLFIGAIVYELGVQLNLLRKGYSPGKVFPVIAEEVGEEEEDH